MKKFDAIIIGTGQAGPALAAPLAGAGMKVAVVERKLFGGTCVNTGCIPTKTLVASARAAYMARRAADFGVMKMSLKQLKIYWKTKALTFASMPRVWPLKMRELKSRLSWTAIRVIRP